MSVKFEPRECPNCGALFNCTGDANCWCLSLHIPEKVQDYIAATFDGCLCEKCIRVLIVKNMINETNP